MEIEQLLKETVGLSEFQTLVYLSLLDKTATAGQLFRKLNINRATLYRVLDELSELSLVVRKQTGKRMFFEALHPDSLRDLFTRKKHAFDEKERLLERVVSELLRKAVSEPTDASIRIEKGISAHFRRMQLELTCKEKVLRSKINNGTSLDDYRNYPDMGDYNEFRKKFIQQRIAKEIYTKILINPNLSIQLRPVNVTNPAELKEVRVMPSEILPDVSLQVFDDYTIFTLRKDKPEDMTIITIRNEVTAGLMKSMFDFIFDRSISTYKQTPLPTFTSNAGVLLPKLGIGTSGVGGYWNKLHPYIDDTGDIDQLRHAIGKGMNYIDTCLLYADGHSTEVVARAIKGMPRADIFINGKLTSFGGPLTRISEIEEQCNRYLKILGTDYLDQFQIHDRKRLGDLPHNEVIEKIGELITDGKVRHWGVSNYSKSDLIEARSFIKEPLHSNEIPFGVFAREYERDGTLEYMRNRNITTIAYFTVRKGGMMVDGFLDPNDSSPLVVLAKKCDKTPTQIALNWVTHHELTMALVKATNGTHVNENVGSVGWEMEESEYEEISKFDRGA